MLDAPRRLSKGAAGGFWLWSLRLLRKVFMLFFYGAQKVMLTLNPNPKPLNRNPARALEEHRS